VGCLLGETVEAAGALLAAAFVAAEAATGAEGVDTPGLAAAVLGTAVVALAPAGTRPPFAAAVGAVVAEAPVEAPATGFVEVDVGDAAPATGLGLAIAAA
jgi:hypothetical protein